MKEIWTRTGRDFDEVYSILTKDVPKETMELCEKMCDDLLEELEKIQKNEEEYYNKKKT